MLLNNKTWKKLKDRDLGEDICICITGEMRYNKPYPVEVKLPLDVNSCADVFHLDSKKMKWRKR